MKVQLLIFRLVSSAGCRLDVSSHLLVTPLRPIQDLRATENGRRASRHVTVEARKLRRNVVEIGEKTASA